MKALTKAIINQATFLALSDEDIIDPDSATQALEQMVAELRKGSKGEIEFIQAEIRQQINQIGEDRNQEETEKVNFFLDFMENLRD